MAATDFLLNTDYPIDKIIGSVIGSYTVGSGVTSFPTQSHGFIFSPLHMLKWSTTSTFNTSFDSIGTSTVDALEMNIQTDISTLYFFILNNSASTVTFYYRIIYFMPSDIDVTATSTVQNFDSFDLNTDYNYTKLLLDSTASSGAQTINHSLTYYPQVEVWYVRSSDGKLIHLVDNEVYASPSNPTSQITTTQLLLSPNATPVTKWYYKVYIDAA